MYSTTTEQPLNLAAVNAIIDSKLDGFFARLTPFLDNCRSDEADMPESEDGMKQLKERVQIGTDNSGKPIYKWATGHTRQEVLQNAARILNEYGQIETHTQQTDGPYFNEYVRDWYENIRSKQMPDRIKEERGRLNNYIYPFFTGKRLTDIKPGDIDAYFMQDRIQALSKSTVSKHGQFLNMVFRFAVRNEDITKNPVIDYKHDLPKRVEKRKALSREDAVDICSHLYELEGEDRLLLALLLFTGMRRGEALGLQVKHINPLRHTVKVEQAVSYMRGGGNTPTIKSPKTKTSERTIPILDGFPYDLIEGKEPDAFILGGASPWTQRKFARTWERIGKTINLHGATPHIFRHTYITLGIAMGIDPKTMQGIAGHATADVTMNVYAHLQTEKIFEAREQMRDMYTPAM